MKLLWKSSDFSFYNKYLFRFNNYAASTLNHIFGAKTLIPQHYYKYNFLST